MYKCECGKEFENQQSFLGHKANCEIHLRAVGKEYWIGENRANRCREKHIEKYGSLEAYSKHLSEVIREGNKKRTDTVDYYATHIDKEQFIHEYIEENRPRSYMRDKYHISDYMMDQLVKRFDCKKDKKQSSKIGWATKYLIYPPDNINNWQKGHQTRIHNSGSVKESYRQGLVKQQQTMLEKYGTMCSLNLEYLSNHRKKKHSGPNETFARILERNELSYTREFCLGVKSYDFKVNDVLFEINPTATHNNYFIPYGDYKGLEENYHYDKSKLANDNNYRCVHIWDWDDVNKLISLFKPRETVYARKCVIKEVSLYDAKSYLNAYHLQGYAKDNIRLGLYFKDILVSLMTFDKPRYNKNYEYELIRYVSTYNVLGGAEKLFKHFITTYSPSSIISYCDKSKFQGKVYNQLGFISKGVSLGKHWYNMKTGKHITDNLLRQRGFDQLLGKEYGCYGKGTSNEVLMLQHDFLPITDAGQETFVWISSVG